MSGIYFFSFINWEEDIHLKIIITGGAGLIGSHICDRLVNEGHDVMVIDNLCSGKREFINSHAFFLEKDIRDKDLKKIIIEYIPDVFIHCAAQISVKNSGIDPINDAAVNILGSLNILESVKSINLKKFIFAASGGTVYGEQKYFPADENHELKPLSPYGIAKFSVENYLNFYNINYGLNYVSLRYSNVYGPRQNTSGEAGVAAIFSKKISKGENPTINGDGLQTRDFIYIDDVVEVNLKAIESDFIGSLNISTGIETNIISIFNILKRISKNNKIIYHTGLIPKGEPRRSVLDPNKAKRIFKWFPKVSLEEGLERTYKWLHKLVPIE